MIIVICHHELVTCKICVLNWFDWKNEIKRGSMLKTLERYQKCNYVAPETNVQTREIQVISIYGDEYIYSQLIFDLIINLLC